MLRRSADGRQTGEGMDIMARFEQFTMLAALLGAQFLAVGTILLG
jgi:hypothetical protein